MMFSGLFGNETIAKVLLYFQRLEQGYPRAIAKATGIPVSQVQRQLERLEREGVIVSHLLGKTRLYEWNPRCGYLNELRSLLERGFQMIPPEQRPEWILERRRPRRKGKPLP